jgi:hypothetical protein
VFFDRDGCGHEDPAIGPAPTRRRNHIDVILAGADVSFKEGVVVDQRWVTSLGTIRAIADVDPVVAAGVFGSRRAVAIGGWPGATIGRAWASFARFAGDVAAGAIPDDVTIVMYDPESWDATPPDERRDPVTYIEAFCRLARSHRYSVMVTPHPNLVSTPGGACEQRPGETREAAYLRSGIVEVSAANADVYEVQAQRLQGDPAAYREFVVQTAALARKVNPSLQVLSGLSTHPGYAASSEMLFDAWDAVRDVVGGHYLSLARRRFPAVAASFLSRMVGAGIGSTNVRVARTRGEG